MNKFFDKLPIIGKIIPGKITLSFLMFLLSVVMLIIFKTSDRKICVLAMLFSFIGDFVLNHKANHDKQTFKDFVVGAFAFIIAHLFYCIAFTNKILFKNYEVINLGFIFAIVLLFAITIFFVISSKSKAHFKLIAFAIIYLWLTGINYVTIFSYAYSVRSLESICALGGLLFLLSDVIIGFERFSGLKSKIARMLVWWFYPIGQIILIITA